MSEQEKRNAESGLQRAIEKWLSDFGSVHSSESTPLLMARAALAVYLASGEAYAECEAEHAE